MLSFSSRGVGAVARNSSCFLFLALFPLVQGRVPSQDQEIRVHDLPSLTAKSNDPSDVLMASLGTILHDKDVCCGKDSALADTLASVDPKSLKNVAAKIGARHLLSDGRPIEIKTTYLTPEMINGPSLAHLVLDQHASLIEWNSHLYVLHGLVFFWESDNPGESTTVIRKLLLWDLRYSDTRREVLVDRTDKDSGTVNGLLVADVAK